MSSKSSHLLTDINEHWYYDFTDTSHVLELDGHDLEINGVWSTFTVTGDSELATELNKLLGRCQVSEGRILNTSDAIIGKLRDGGYHISLSNAHTIEEYETASYIVYVGTDTKLATFLYNLS